jgi:D-amino peptidase
VEEAQAYVPDIEGVVVKEGLSRTSALTLAPAKARTLIREGARRAMGLVGKIRPYTVAPPYDFRTQYLAAQSADDKARRPEVERIDLHTVKVSGEDFLDVISRR